MAQDHKDLDGLRTVADVPVRGLGLRQFGCAACCFT